MSSIKICIYHPSGIHLKAYQLVFSSMTDIEVVGLHHEFGALCQCLEGNGADLALISHERLRGIDLEYSRRKIRELFPKVGVVVIGTAAVEAFPNEFAQNPVRGLIDFEVQSRAQIIKSIKRIKTKGTDFGLVRLKYPRLSDQIDHYVSSLPNVNERFWEVIPLLATGANMDAIASYFNVTRKTINSWLNGYCDEFGVENTKELLVIAANNQWVDLQLIQRMKRRLNDHQLAS